MIENCTARAYPGQMPILFKSLWRGSNSGNAAIEFALVAPLLVLLLSGIVEIGLAVRTSYALQAAVLAGSNQASHKGWDTTAIRSAITSSSPRLTHATITLTRFCGCPSGTSITTIAACDNDPANPGTCPMTCTAVCTSDQLAVRKYATLTASLPRQTVFGSSFGLAPTLSTTMRTRLP